MAEHGEWTRQGRSLSDVTAVKEYGISRDFILEGIRSGKLEYRQGVMFGNSYLKILRNQLEQYTASSCQAYTISCLIGYSFPSISC
jgi:hypothetical protein